jgi:hypothetical protein
MNFKNKRMLKGSIFLLSSSSMTCSSSGKYCSIAIIAVGPDAVDDGFLPIISPFSAKKKSSFH